MTRRWNDCRHSLTGCETGYALFHYARNESAADCPEPGASCAVLCTKLSHQAGEDHRARRSRAAGLDLIGRTIGDQLSRALDQSFVIENIGGGGGSIACQTTARAAPDGYTLMVGYVATHATSPAVRKVPYDAIKDFTPIAMVGGTRNMLVVHPSVPVSDLKGFVEYAKAKANKVTFGAGRHRHAEPPAHRAAQGGGGIRRGDRRSTRASGRRSPTCSAASSRR